MKPYGQHLVKANLYNLKKHWGSPVEWYQLIDTSMDVTTGLLDTNYKVVKIRKGILLPKQGTRGFKYSLSYLAANKNFVYGGYFDSDKRYLIVDVRDLPKDWNVDHNQVEYNDKIIIDGQRYSLTKSEDYDYNLAYVLTLTHVKGSEADAIHEVEATNSFEASNGGTV